MKHNLSHIKHRAHELVSTALEDTVPHKLELEDGTVTEYYTLGQTAALAPSGKIYNPMQAPTLAPCPKCKGAMPRKEACQYCGMTGSREFFEDRVFFTTAEKTAMHFGLHFFTLMGEAYMYKTSKSM